MVLPQTAQQVAGVRRRRSAVRGPGSGTGLSGETLPHPEGVLIVTTRMRRILEIDVVATIHNDLVPAIPQPAQIGVGDQRPAGCPAQKMLFPDHQKTTVRQPVHAVPGGFGPGATTSPLPSRSTATISCAPQFENHRHPSCHRGDSPTTRPLIKIGGSTIAFHLRPAGSASAVSSASTRTVSERIDTTRSRTSDRSRTRDDAPSQGDQHPPIGTTGRQQAGSVAAWFWMGCRVARWTCSRAFGGVPAGCWSCLAPVV